MFRTKKKHPKHHIGPRCLKKHSETWPRAIISDKHGKHFTKAHTEPFRA